MNSRPVRDPLATPVSPPPSIPASQYPRHRISADKLVSQLPLVYFQSDSKVARRLQSAIEQLPIRILIGPSRESLDSPIDVLLFDENHWSQGDERDADAWCRILIGCGKEEKTVPSESQADAALPADADLDAWRELVGMGLEVARLRKDLAAAEYQASALQSQANTDALTGLANRRGWEQALRARSSANGDLPVTLIVLDLDCFKDCNDKHGHPFGDDILTTCGNLLQESLRQSDLIARVGGDEFAAVLDGLTGEGVSAIVERIRVRIVQGLRNQFGNSSTTISLGAAHGMLRDHSQLYRLADDALFEAKRGGRDQSRSADQTTR